MDEWSEFFFKFNPEANKVRNHENVDQRLQLRTKLECNSFEWYLTNVWPQHFLPMDTRFFGKVVSIRDNDKADKYQRFLTEKIPAKYRSSWKSLIELACENLNDFHDLMPESEYRSDFCLNRPQTSTVQALQPFGQAALKSCENLSKSLLQQMFIVTEAGKILSDENLCLDASDVLSLDKNQTMVRLITCSETPRQHWHYDWDQLYLQHKATGLCLTTSLSEQQLVIQKCSSVQTSADSSQKWILLPFPWK